MSTHSIPQEVARRRTFAIISHPDAGKTTLTEKLLLFAGAIQIAGSVKARKASRHASSDWMEIEKQRGISVASSVMQMEYRDCVINLLDTPGHQDFSEDTYRVLTAVDAALMVIDAANGVEPQTIRLLQVCRARNTPIITFINKMDREVQEPLDLLAEIESHLAWTPCRSPGLWAWANPSVACSISGAIACVFSVLGSNAATMTKISLMAWTTPRSAAVSAARSTRPRKRSICCRTPRQPSNMKRFWRASRRRCFSVLPSTTSACRKCWIRWWNGAQARRTAGPATRRATG